MWDKDDWSHFWIWSQGFKFISGAKVVFQPDIIIRGRIQTQQCNKFAAINWHCLKKIEATLTDWFRSTFRLRRHFRRFFFSSPKIKIRFRRCSEKNAASVSDRGIGLSRRWPHRRRRNTCSAAPPHPPEWTGPELTLDWSYSHVAAVLKRC